MEKLARTAKITRKTAETDISIELNLDGAGKYEINTGFKFLDHMLTLLTKYSNIDLNIKASGDLKHHIIEDIGIILGKCFSDALGDKRGINRYGSDFVPMDDALARCVVDFSGRYFSEVDLNIDEPIFQENLEPITIKVEDVATEDIRHFFKSFAENAKMNLHLKVLYGEDNHHKIEAGFKALAMAIKEAKKIVSDEIPSTKGLL